MAEKITESALEQLSPREQEILRMRYGLNERRKKYTLAEVGEMFQVTRERIRQIQEKALLKLRLQAERVLPQQPPTAS